MGFFCKLHGCCCGCTLRTGTQIIGVIEAILSVIYIILSIVGVVMISQNDGKIDIGDGQTVDYKDMLAAFKILFIINICFCVFLFLINVLMLCGVSQQRPGLFLPWLIYAVFMLFANLGSSIAFSVPTFQNNQVAFGVTTIISAIISFMVRWYFISVVHSYYREVKRADNTMRA